MKIVWSPEAVEDLVSLRAYIAEDSPATAQRTVRLIIESIEQLLPDNPRMGRAGTGAGHPRTCHSEDTLHRALSAPANNDPNLARLSCGATLA